MSHLPSLKVHHTTLAKIWALHCQAIRSFIFLVKIGFGGSRYVFGQLKRLNGIAFLFTLGFRIGSIRTSISIHVMELFSNIHQLLHNLNKLSVLLNRNLVTRRVNPRSRGRMGFVPPVAPKEPPTFVSKFSFDSPCFFTATAFAWAKREGCFPAVFLNLHYTIRCQYSWMNGSLTLFKWLVLMVFTGITFLQYGHASCLPTRGSALSCWASWAMGSRVRATLGRASMVLYALEEKIWLTHEWTGPGGIVASHASDLGALLLSRGITCNKDRYPVKARLFWRH